MIFFNFRIENIHHKKKLANCLKIYYNNFILKIYLKIMNGKEQKRLNLITSLFYNRDYSEVVNFIVGYNGGIGSIIELMKQAENVYNSKIYMDLGIKFYNIRPIEDVFDFCVNKLSNINTEESLCYLGHLYYKIYDYEKSKFYFEKVLKINCENKVANDHLGAIYLKMSEGYFNESEEKIGILKQAQYHAVLAESTELLDKVNGKIGNIYHG